jgi:hypothetical protein
MYLSLSFRPCSVTFASADASKEWGLFTHASFLDFVRDLHEQLLVLGSVLATNQDLDREPTALELLKMFC